MKYRVTNTSSFPVTLNVVSEGQVQSCQIYPGTHIVSATSIPAQHGLRIEPVVAAASAVTEKATVVKPIHTPSFKKD